MRAIKYKIRGDVVIAIWHLDREETSLLSKTLSVSTTWESTISKDSMITSQKDTSLG